MATTLLSTTDNASNSGNVSVIFYKFTTTPTQPTQQVTIGQYPDSNPTFSRAFQISSEYVFIKRGTSAVAISLSDLAGIASTQVPALSYPPYITAEPSAASVYAEANGANNATFTVAANTESTLTYAWREWNGSAWSANITNGTANNANYVVFGASMNVAPTTNTINGRKFMCVLYNASGNTNSANATITVL
jgi:hypothetical protein